MSRFAPCVFLIRGRMCWLFRGAGMLLLHLYGCFLELGLPIRDVRVFHLDHALRPESEEEADFVVRSARELGFPVHLDRCDVRRFARRAGRGLEESGRILRYRSLGRLFRSFPGALGVTGHHADDYLESLLMHLVRGGGRAAFSTMELVSEAEGVRVFRPLLSVSRSAIDALVRRSGIRFLEDLSNASEGFLRNRLRKSVTPVLRSEGLDVVRLWDNFHDRESPLPAGRAPEVLRLDRGLFSGIRRSECKGLFDLVFRRMGLGPSSAGLVSEVWRQLSRGEGFRLRFEDPRVLVWSAESGPVWVISRFADVFLPFEREFRGEGDSGEREFVVRYAGRSEVCRLREWEEWARFSPGMRVALPAGGTKKLKKVFQELRFPPPVRRNLPLIRDGRSGLVVRVCRNLFEPSCVDLFLG